MELDGAVPADQPFRSSYVYSFGHRNPQGLAWIGRQLYSSEHGQSEHDEVNKIEPGANYGWPVIEGSDEKRGMKAPLIHSGEKTWAPSGLAQKGDVLYMAGLRGEGVSGRSCGSQSGQMAWRIRQNQRCKSNRR